MKPSRCSSRRGFLRASVVGGLGAVTLPSWLRAAADAASPSAATSPGCRVALTHGDSRADLAFRALQPFAQDVRQAIGNRRIVIKPNNVSIDNPLCATHAETIEGILEFLKSINCLEKAVIAESAAGGPTLEGFSNYGYPRVAGKYGVRMVDLDQEPYDRIHVFDEKDFSPHPVRMSRLLLDPNTFIISAARMKTHDRVVATLSLKNIIFGAPIKDLGFSWGRDSKPGTRNDKPIAHGSGFRAINYNLFALAQRLHPHLAVIDGFEGMQGNGPVGGTPVDHRVCVASPDWLAADRVAVELMGIDFANVGYLNFCTRAGLGEGDLARIDVVGARVADHTKPYRLSDNIAEQMVWKQPPRAA
jgi:uncharacterized protein (DUF362 family)